MAGKYFNENLFSSMAKYVQLRIAANKVLCYGTAIE